VVIEIVSKMTYVYIDFRVHAHVRVTRLFLACVPA